MANVRRELINLKERYALDKRIWIYVAISAAIIGFLLGGVSALVYCQ